jgi:hypothetical protein
VLIVFRPLRSRLADSFPKSDASHPADAAASGVNPRLASISTSFCLVWAGGHVRRL